MSASYNPVHHAFYEIGQKYDWFGWAADYTGLKKNIKAGELIVSVMEVKEDGRTGDYDGEYSSGSEEPTYILFEVTFPDTFTPKYFRKNGVYDSYGVGQWDGKFEEVAAVEKTVTVFEPVS